MEPTTSSFIKKAVLISAAAAAGLFAICALLLTFSAQLTKTAAISAANSGHYQTAIDRLMSIEDEDSELRLSGLYSVAGIMLSDREFQQAHDLFYQLGDYSNSAEMASECLLQQAQQYIAEQDHKAAAELLSEIFSYSNAAQLYSECQYARAGAELAAGNWFAAVQYFWSVKDYSDAESRAREVLLENTGSDNVEMVLGTSGPLTNEQLELCFALSQSRETITNGRVAVGFSHTVGLCADGTVIACGSNEQGQCNTEQWHDAVQVAAGAYHTVALLSSGRVTACGSNEYGQCDTDDWSNVVQIAANDYTTYALLADGTVISCGFHDYDAVTNWHNADLLFADSYTVGCLYNDGYLAAANASGTPETSSFFVDAALSSGYYIGLTSDGQVKSNAPLPDSWEKSVAVYASPSYAAVINAEGAISVFYFRDQSDVTYTFDSQVVSAALGGTHFALLLADGRVFAFGLNTSGQCSTEQWNLN